MDGYKKREAGRWVSVSLSVGVVAVGSGCLLVGVQLPEWRKVLQCWVYEVNGHAVHCLLQQLVKRERAVGDGYGIEIMISDSGILLGIILNFCHFLSD